MKKLVCSLLSLLLLFLILPQVSHAATSSSVSLVLNGQTLKSDVPAQKVNDYVMVPLRLISQNFGASVEYRGVEQKVIVKKDGKLIELFIGKKTALINAEPFALDAAPVVIDGRALVPVRFVANGMGISVQWINKTQTVILTTAQAPVPVPSPTPSATPTPTPTPTATPSPTATPTPASTPTATPSPTSPTGTTTPDPNLYEPGTTPPPSQANSEAGYTKLMGIEVTDSSLTLYADGPLAPKVSYVSSPDRLVIDVPAVTFSDSVPRPISTSEGLVAVDHPLVAKVRYSNFDPVTRTIRIVADLKAKTSYHVGMNGTDGAFSLLFSDAKYKIVIDAGHGDTDPGAISITKRNEKDFNLAIALKVNELLGNVKQVETYMTRSDDTFVSLDGRADFANSLGADAFISIHGNNFTASSRGTETYYWNSYSKTLADIVHKHVLAATGFPDRKVQKNDFRVVKATKMPGILIEVGFLSNAVEEALMYTPDFQYKVAASIVDGIKEYFNIQ
ncbi:N-acetylmuramoyl-L-alanine amidase family protein [Gorillibacterium timonense]|uniref:N-acetylmuramoyl-L-alanine amidase family protein n=1 Tax=Gorillibacterium timonense TaxID=1689269 RepID=UPI00071DCFA5|nr:N-acetylmuramoyl-L-alanine amidase family protein [Gorillibacterium timonense]